MTVNKIDKDPCPHEAFVLSGETGNMSRLKTKLFYNYLMGYVSEECHVLVTNAVYYVINYPQS